MQVIQIETDKGEIFFTDIFPTDAVLWHWNELGYKMKVGEMSEKDFREASESPQSKEFFARSASQKR